MGLTREELARHWTDTVKLEHTRERPGDRHRLEWVLLNDLCDGLEAVNRPIPYPAIPPTVSSSSAAVLREHAEVADLDHTVVLECRKWVGTVAQIEAVNFKRLSGVLWGLRKVAEFQAGLPEDVTPERREPVDNLGDTLWRFLRAQWGVTTEPPLDVLTQVAFAKSHSTCPEDVCPAEYRHV